MMNHRISNLPALAPVVMIAAALMAGAIPNSARAQQLDAKALVAAAVNNELASDRNDHTAFMYNDHDITPEHNTLYFMVETPQGNLKRELQDHGKPLNQQQRTADDQRIQALLNDPAVIARRKKDSAHDDDQAEQMLKLLPRAYQWSVAQENGDLIALNFKPDPNFSSSSMESRVLSAMGGQLVLDRRENRIRSIQGHLLADVTFGYGLFGRLRKGGSFEVQRREVAPGHWQMTENHTHIDGKALFFKTIGSQEDEVRFDFKLSPAQSMQQAWEIMQRQAP